MHNYMPTRDYDSLESVASLINDAEYAIVRIRESVGAMYPDNARFVSQADFEDDVNNFERVQRDLIRALDTLIP